MFIAKSMTSYPVYSLYGQKIYLDYPMQWAYVPRKTFSPRIRQLYDSIFAFKNYVGSLLTSIFSEIGINYMNFPTLDT